jgi:DNA mismatch repair protein MutS
LIEHIEKNELYVTNDIEIGEKGILLFGTNAVGKTSLIKAIGICVIMAQAGLYVPCSQMTYSPYEYIFTRIIGNDNIFKGLSTFGVEMSELRVILNHCNKNSLILGDELCSGTEIDSALSIFIAGLETMHMKKSSFIFATHFHQIQHYEEIKRMNISLKHLKVQYNHEQNVLVYDRKLADGAGESIYGLEVCKSLDMPDDFLRRAYEIRNKDCVLNLGVSRYNKHKMKGVCEFCKKKIGNEIHHLQYQQHANDKDYINSFHKDHVANLASICDACHHHIHSLGLVYEKKKTFEGYNLILR